MGTLHRISGIGEYGFIWVLNPMQGNAENKSQFGPFNTRDEALSFVANERVEPYADNGDCAFGLSAPGEKVFRKTFKKGGPLEWMNDHTGDPENFSPWGHGLHRVLIDVREIHDMGPL
jgi:hypothetical protein